MTLHISAARHHHTRKMIRQMVEDGRIPPCAILLTLFKPHSQPDYYKEKPEVTVID